MLQVFYMSKSSILPAMAIFVCLTRVNWHLVAEIQYISLFATSTQTIIYLLLLQSYIIAYNSVL